MIDTPVDMVLIVVPPQIVATTALRPDWDQLSTLNALKIERDSLDAALALRKVDLESSNPTVSIHADGAPLQLHGFSGRIVTISLDEIRRAAPNWAIEGRR